MADPPALTADQQQEAQHFTALFLQLAQREAQRFGELIASRPDEQLLGRTEFDLRTLVHQLGATFLETALPSCYLFGSHKLSLHPRHLLSPHDCYVGGLPRQFGTYVQNGL